MLYNFEYFFINEVIACRFILLMSSKQINFGVNDETYEVIK